MEEQGLDPADVVLYRYCDGGWGPLPTAIDEDDATTRHFSARSPGCSLFAIGGDPSSPAAAAAPSETQTSFPAAMLVVAIAIAAMAVRKRE
ncbi:PGF-pre-PGF domain-containing protein [Methanofollis formosanus]|uniref:PGF-pre-PGF domain-containing protein n=1 Tax=Methanofollis formosanus TaxID=299308 RepID=UPI003CCEBF66